MVLSENDLTPLSQRSRQTRHQDAASRSRQGHVIDLDPTDGLPVQRWGLTKVTINQDTPTDSSSANPKSTSSAEWATQFNTEQHPWPERPLPSYFNQLTPWNQELIRKKRAGNTNPTLSTYDRKINSWISGAEQDRKAAAAKKLSDLNITDSTEKPRNGNDAESSKSGDDSGAEDSSNEYNKSADEDEFDGDETTPFKASAKRRKVTSRHHGSDNTRSFDVTKWMPLPPSSVDKSQDRTCLAPRRLGMPPLYTNPEYAMKIFGKYHSSSFLTNTSSYDLGEGGGLNNASGVLAAGTTTDTGVTTPRKNVPPRRKKKKLGGPGRKKANPTPVPSDANGVQVSAAAGTAGQGAGTDAMEGVAGDDGQGVDTSGNTTRNPDYDGAQDDAAAHDDENDNESGSEAEGSEEGEIDESGGVASGSGSGSAHIAEAPPTVIVTAAPTTSVHDEVTVGTKSTESKPIDEAQDVAIPPPAVDTTTSTSAIATEPTVEQTTTAPSTDTDKDTAISTPSASTSTPTLTNPQPTSPDTTTFLPPPTVTITDADTDKSNNPTTAIDTLMPDANHRDPEETAIIEENAQAITGSGAANTAATGEKTKTQTETGNENENKNEDGNGKENEKGNEKEGEKGEEKMDAEEIDFLGGLDAEIDRGISEGS